MELSYREVYRMNPQEARRRLRETYQETGSLSETARRRGTSRHLVRKWVRRFLEGRERPVSGIEAVVRSLPPQDPRGD